MTAELFRFSRAECLGAGFDGYLEKPYARQGLIDSVESVPAGTCSGRDRLSGSAPPQTGR